MVILKLRAYIICLLFILIQNCATNRTLNAIEAENSGFNEIQGPNISRDFDIYIMKDEKINGKNYKSLCLTGILKNKEKCLLIKMPIMTHASDEIYVSDIKFNSDEINNDYAAFKGRIVDSLIEINEYRESSAASNNLHFVITFSTEALYFATVLDQSDKQYAFHKSWDEVSVEYYARDNSNKEEWKQRLKLAGSVLLDVVTFPVSFILAVALSV